MLLLKLKINQVVYIVSQYMQSLCAAVNLTAYGIIKKFKLLIFNRSLHYIQRFAYAVLACNISTFPL